MAKRQHEPANRHDGWFTWTRDYTPHETFCCTKNLNDSYINPSKYVRLCVALFLCLLHLFPFVVCVFVCVHFTPENHFLHNELKPTGAYWAPNGVRERELIHKEHIDLYVCYHDSIAWFTLFSVFLPLSFPPEKTPHKQALPLHRQILKLNVCCELLCI